MALLQTNDAVATRTCLNSLEKEQMQTGPLTDVKVLLGGESGNLILLSTSFQC